MHKILVTIYEGVVDKVEGVPPGMRFQVRDYDPEGMSGKRHKEKRPDSQYLGDEFIITYDSMDHSPIPLPIKPPYSEDYPIPLTLAIYQGLVDRVEGPPTIPVDIEIREYGDLWNFDDDELQTDEAGDQYAQMFLLFKDRVINIPRKT